MRYMVLVKATANSEAGVQPSEQLINDMGKFNAELEKAGVLRAGDGLAPSSQGARVKVSGGRKTVTDGPFAETNELVAGYWILEVKDLAEAIEWIRRAPDAHPGEDTEYEIRRMFGSEDFTEMSPEARAAEDRMRDRLAGLD
jgi:hypothetical protein